MIRNAYLKKVESRLELLGEDIDSLKRKAETASADARDQFARQAKVLAAKAETVKEKIKVVRAAGATNWGHMKKGADEALEDLRQAVENAFQRFRKTGSDRR